MNDSDQPIDDSSGHPSWPPDVASLLGSWKDKDFPEAEQIRDRYGNDVPREEL